MEDILIKLKSMMFNSPEEVKDYINSCKLTIPKLHQLYKMWYKCDKSCLQGNKDAMIHGLMQTIKSLSGHMTVMFYDTPWSLMTNQQKQCFVDCREINNSKNMEVHKSFALPKELWDINYENFIKYIE